MILQKMADLVCKQCCLNNGRTTNASNCVAAILNTPFMRVFKLRKAELDVCAYRITLLETSA